MVTVQVPFVHLRVDLCNDNSVPSLINSRVGTADVTGTDGGRDRGGGRGLVEFKHHGFQLIRFRTYLNLQGGGGGEGGREGEGERERERERERDRERERESE